MRPEVFGLWLHLLAQRWRAKSHRKQYFYNSPRQPYGSDHWDQLDVSRKGNRQKDWSLDRTETVCATETKVEPTNLRRTLRYLRPIFVSVRERYDTCKINRHQYGVCQKKKSGAINTEWILYHMPMTYANARKVSGILWTEPIDMNTQ